MNHQKDDAGDVEIEGVTKKVRKLDFAWVNKYPVEIIN